MGTLLAAGLHSVLALATGVLVARTLGPEGKGAVTLVALVFSEFPLVLSLGVEIAVIYYGGRARYPLPTLASAAMGLSLVLGATGTLAALALFAFAFRQRIPAELTSVIVLMSCIIPLDLFTRILRNLARVSGRTVEERFLTALQTLLILLLVAVALWRGWGLPGALYGYGLGQIFSSGAVIILARRWGLVRSGPTFPVSLWKSLVGYGSRIHVGRLLQHLNYRLDTYMITFFLGGASVGLYSVAVAMAEWLWIIPEVLGPALMQRVATRSELDANRFMPPLLRLTSTVLFLGVATWALAGSWVIRRLYGEAFSASYVPLLLLLPGIWSLGLWKSLMHDLSVRGYPIYLTWTSAVGVVLTVVLNLVLVPRWGIAGAAIASSVAYTAAFLTALRLYGRVTKTTAAQLLVPRLADFSDMLVRLRNLRGEAGRGAVATPAARVEVVESEGP
ncbi:MAG: oligosaccharide flippase family protein [Terriglobales bacterium]